MKKTNSHIALIGLDGSGKSANIDIMKKDGDYSDYNFLWVRWEPTLLKPLYSILNKKVKSSDEQKNVSEKQELDEQYNKKSGLKEKLFKNPIVCSAWLSLALVDYYFQFKKKTSKYLKNQENIIFDRFYLDLFVDQGINFGYTPEKIEKKIEKYSFLFPKTDKFIYIRVSPEVCFSRKDDIPNMDYLEKRYDIYELLSKNENWITVDGEMPLEKVNSEIKSIILN